MTMSDFWEPWKPQIGQRVRVRVSPECRTPGHPDSVAREIGQIGHLPDESGRVGIVWEDDAPAPFGHRFLIRLDTPYWYHGELIGWSCYPAVELEPVEPIS